MELFVKIVYGWVLNERSNFIIKTEGGPVVK